MRGGAGRIGALLRKVRYAYERRVALNDRIDPKDLIRTLSVEELCATAEDYYRKIHDPTPQMTKPFAFLQETPELLHRMGLIISGLRLGTTMTVLDFGAGTCWLSRFLAQLHCYTISVDASRTALEIGKRLFRELPLLGGTTAEPRFVLFNGHTIDVADESMDRIVCFDTFHHVPNQREVLREFFRVLKWGGIVGFSEPGRGHSQSPQSQYEMRNYQVLENDIVLEDILEEAKAIGFTDVWLKLVCTPGLDLLWEDYRFMTAKRRLPDGVRSHLIESNRQGTVFFFAKGSAVPDSRSPVGLAHRLRPSTTSVVAKRNEPVSLKVSITNTGTAKWLHENTGDYGVVKVGMHLYDANRTLVDLDFFRSRLVRDVSPGEGVEQQVTVTLRERGRYILGVDLVAEKITWFENVGSAPMFIEVFVE